MTKDISKWKDFEYLEFTNEEFGILDLSPYENSKNCDFNAQLEFKNCFIRGVSDAIKVYTKKVSFVDCEIGYFAFHGTCFQGGLEISNCIIHELSFFNAIGHNSAPNEFIILNCIFKEYVDFFDCYFEGPVRITKNNFMQGTNVGIYLQRPFGIVDEQEYFLDDNVGDLCKAR